MGRVQFTNTDSAGNPVTSQLTETIDGERYEIEVASTGTAMVPAHVEEYLVESDEIQVEPYDPE